MVRVDATIEVRSRDHNVVYHALSKLYVCTFCAYCTTVYTEIFAMWKFSPNVCHWRKFSPSEKFATSGIWQHAQLAKRKLVKIFTQCNVRAIGKFFTGKNFCVYGIASGIACWYVLTRVPLLLLQ